MRGKSSKRVGNGRNRPGLMRNAFIFFNVYHRSLVFLTSKVREVFQGLSGEGIRFNGPQSRVNKIAL